MSSNPRASPRRRPRSLRATLIAEQVVLLAMVCLVIGVVTLVVLRSFLVDQLEHRLDQGAPRGGVPGRMFPNQGPGALIAEIRGDEIVYAQILQLQDQAAVPDELYTVLETLPADGVARSRSLRGLGDYLLVADRAGPDQIRVNGLPLATVDQTVWTVALVLGGVSLIGLAVAAMAGVVIVRRTLRPLDRMADTAARVARLPLDRGEVALPDRVPAADTDPRTEVGQVGSALNQMLGHVADALAARHASETRVRQFVADASHELRTPLAAIRGYTELARRRDDELPPAIAHALTRVESESARMTTLVEDLLLLARLDSGRPLLAEPVDLSRLVIDAVSDARVAGPDHHWRLDLPAAPVHVIGDEARLHQIVANLLANGRTHTPPGSTVTTGVAVEHGAAILRVTDDGPGVPPALRGEIFERFARGDTSRSRAAGGTGLGLAIVAAVVHAHGGDVRVDSRPGATVFTVSLPAHPTT